MIYVFKHTKYIYTKEVMEHFDTDDDGVITFDEYIIPHGLDVEDLSEENKLRLDIERRSFDRRDKNLNGALEGF